MSNFLDRCGMTVSGLCGIHCVALVVISMVQPVILWAGSYAQWLRPLEIILAAAAGMVASAAFLSGYRHHGHLKPVLLGAVGVAVIFTSVFSPLHEYSWAAVMTAAGGLALIVGHRWNIRCRCAHSAQTIRAPKGALGG